MRYSVVLACLILVTIGINEGGHVPSPKRNLCNYGSNGCSKGLKLHRRDIESDNHDNIGENIRNMEDDLQFIGALDRIYNSYSGFYPQNKVELSNGDVGNKDDESGDNKVQSIQSYDNGQDSITNNKDTGEWVTVDEGRNDDASSGNSWQKNSNLDLGNDNIISTENTDDIMALLDTDTNNDRNNGNHWQTTGSSTDNVNNLNKNTREWGNMDVDRSNYSSRGNSWQNNSSLENGNDINIFNDFKNIGGWRSVDADNNGNTWQNSGNLNRDDMNSNNTNNSGNNWQFWQNWGTGNMGNNYSNDIQYRWQNTGNRKFGMGVGDGDRTGNNWRNKQRWWNNDIGNRNPNTAWESNRDSRGKNVKRNWIDNYHARNMLRNIVGLTNDKTWRKNSTGNGEDFIHSESGEHYYSE